MSELGSRIMAQRNAAVEGSTPSVHFRSRLGSKSDSWHQRPRGRYDVVVASYALGETLAPAERRRLVDSLWQHTSGVLVLIEPGTPSGSANIRQARSQVCRADLHTVWNFSVIA
jgi:ribosomal protein RSM22 (predicted rRNA methylase)